MSLQYLGATLGKAESHFNTIETYATNARTTIGTSATTALNDLISAAWSVVDPSSVEKYPSDQAWSTIDAARVLLNLYPTAPLIKNDEIDDPPEATEPVYGVKPIRQDYEIPPVPTLTDVVVPDMPPIGIPTFNETIGLDFSVIPNVTIDGGALHYDESLLVALIEKLEYDIREGGTGLRPEIEDAIWLRESEREARALADAVDKLEDQFAKKAFALPSSLLAEQISILHKDYQIKRIDRSREIAIEQAKLEQENIKHRLGLAMEVEKILQDIWERTQERVLQASVKVAEYAFETFKAQITKHNAAIERYKAMSEAYKNVIQGEMLKVEIYKGQIEGLKAIVELDDVRIKAYVGQIQGIQALIETYKAEVQAYVAEIEGEKAKIDIYKARIDAWASKVKAVIDIYLGKMEGAKSWVDGYTKIESLNLQGISEKVRAYAAWAATEIEKIKAWVMSATEGSKLKTEALKAAATIYAGLWTSFALSTTTQVHYQATGSSQESRAEQLHLSGGG